jgi:O-acetylhomoserine/O-acetylserine sulfhydrylase-like pyridoxal-dependent enzyme
VTITAAPTIGDSVNDDPQPPSPAAGGFATRSLHAGTPPDPATGSRAQPIHATSSYVFASAAHAAALFAGEATGNQYARMHNPTVDAFAERMRSLEGGAGAVALASGQAASAATLLALARPGARVVLSQEAFGGTFALFRKWLEPWGLRVTTVAPTPSAVGGALDDDVVAVWVETIANPSCSVPDLPAIAAAAHAAGAPLVVDNTWGCGGYLCRPLDHGADVVVHSATKWIGGHGTFVGGVVVDGGRFGYDAARFPAFHARDPRGRSLLERHGDAPLAARVHDLGLFTLGATLSPFAAFLGLQGLETLELRSERSCATALELARWLEGQEGVVGVRYAGLPSHPSHAVARRLLQHGFGAVLALDLPDQGAAHRFLDALRLVSQLANIGDAKSVAIHPWTTTHSSLGEDARRAAGVLPGTVRLSLGLEAVADLRADLAVAVRAACA